MALFRIRKVIGDERCFTRVTARHLRAVIAVTLLVVLAAPLPAPPSATGQPVIQYVYDPLGRLIAVIDQHGNVATYEYDAVGNILAIERVDASAIPGAVVIFLVLPNSGTAGTTVTIIGRGFSSTPAQNTVAFNGVGAGVAASTGNQITTSVPAGATTGSIVVTSPAGLAISPTPFMVPGTIAISPPSAEVVTRGTLQFTGSQTGNPSATFNWSVNGITGGDSTVGTISTTGFYMAPNTRPVPSVVTVSAALSGNPGLYASAPVRVVTLPPTVFQAGAAVSGQVAPPAPPPPTAFLAGRGVAVAFEPVISQVSPGSAPAGTSGLSITIDGAGFLGATALDFRLANAIDTNITVSNLVVNGTGTQATAIISIAAGAALGARVVEITVPGAFSLPTGTGGNLFTVQ
jgi:YD repeat-containing protein